jgi:hydroxyacylglutathione hydrolase
MHIVAAAVPPFHKNGFLVRAETTPDGILIDPGDEVDELLQAARDSDCLVHAILLTHAHFDHITGVGRARAAFAAPIWLHRDDLFLYDGVVEQGRLFGLHAERQPPVDAFYEPGVALTLGALRVDPLHTPGHCPGGVCLAVDEPGRAGPELFVGDTLFAGSIGRTDLPGGSYHTLMRSIRDVLLRFPDATVVHPGHGPDTTIGAERRTNPFLAG